MRTEKEHSLSKTSYDTNTAVDGLFALVETLDFKEAFSRSRMFSTIVLLNNKAVTAVPLAEST